MRKKSNDPLYPLMIQWSDRSGSEAEVSANFTLQEWWSLGSEGIIWEIQQVYKNFIIALDVYIPSFQAQERNSTK